MKKLPPFPARYIDAIGQGKKLVIGKSSGPVDTNNAPKGGTSVSGNLHPFTGKKCC